MMNRNRALNTFLLTVAVSLGLPLNAQATREAKLGGVQASSKFDKVVGAFAVTFEGDEIQSLMPIEECGLPGKPECGHQHLTQMSSVHAIGHDQQASAGLIVVGAAVCFAGGVILGNAIADFNPRNLKLGDIRTKFPDGLPANKVFEAVAAYVTGAGGRMLIARGVGPIIARTFVSVGLATYATSVAVCAVSGLAGKALHKQTSKIAQQVVFYVVSQSRGAIQKSLP